MGSYNSNLTSANLSQSTGSRLRLKNREVWVHLGKPFLPV